MWEFYSNLYHLFVPWDDYNTVWVALLAIPYLLRLNRKYVTNPKSKKYSETFDSSFYS